MKVACREATSRLSTRRREMSFRQLQSSSRGGLNLSRAGMLWRFSDCSCCRTLARRLGSMLVASGSAEDLMDCVPSEAWHPFGDLDVILPVLAVEMERVWGFSVPDVELR